MSQTGGTRVMDTAGNGREAPYPPHILVVDDDPASRDLARQFLERHGFLVDEACDGPPALQAITREPPALVVLDLGLPGLDGLDVLPRVRRTHDVPVIIVTGRTEETARLQGLALGADDYVTKPYSLPELEARIRAVLRRAAGPDRRDDVLDFDVLAVDLAGHRIIVHGEEVEMTAMEFDLVACLAESPGRVFSREELLERVWGSTERWQVAATVTEHVRRVRRKIEDRPERPRWITTVRGAGYRFDPHGGAD